MSLIGYIIYSDTKRKSAEALVENLDTKKKLNELDKNVAKNEGLEEAEQEKRDEILKDLEHNKAKEDSIEDLKKFFDKPTDPK